MKHEYSFKNIITFYNSKKKKKKENVLAFVLNHTHSFTHPQNIYAYNHLCCYARLIIIGLRSLHRYESSGHFWFEMISIDSEDIIFRAFTNI